MFALDAKLNLSAAIVPQMKVEVLTTHVYGIEVKFGMGVKTAAEMQKECHAFGADLYRLSIYKQRK